MENATSFAFELDKPYTVQRDDEEEITVCSKGSSSSNPQEKDNVLHYRTEVPIRVRMKYQKLFEQAFEYYLWFKWHINLSFFLICRDGK